MNQNTKPIIIVLLVALLVVIITAGTIKKNESVKITGDAGSGQVETAQKNILKESPLQVRKKVSFKSNDEIKKEYGKLETVFLWNGRKYTGAVISTDPVYSIVTLEGTINIPIKDVKIREIIR